MKTQSVGDLVAQLRGCDDSPPRGPTVADIVREFMASRDVAAATSRTDDSVWRNHIEPRWSNVPAGELRPADIEQALAAMSRGTRYGVHKLLRAAYRRALRDEVVDRDPMDHVAPPRRHYRTVWMVEDQQAAFWRAYVDLLNEGRRPEGIRCTGLALLLGTRLGETRSLEWSEIDFGGRLIRLRAAKVKNRRSGALPCPDPALRILEQQRERWRDICTPWVFPSQRDPMRHIVGVYVAWRVLKKRAQLPDDVVFHSLRHTWATMAVRSGIDLARVQRHLRHEHIQTTMRYVHLGDYGATETADAVAQAVGPKGGLS